MRDPRLQKLLVGACIGCACSACFAEEPATGGYPGDRIEVSIGIELTTAYFFRGIVQEDDGFIMQPCAELGVALIEKDDYSLSVFGGLWASVHGDTGTAGPDSSTPNIYELDLYSGMAVSVGSWDFSAAYIAYTSPSDAFDTVEELVFGVGYDDSEKPLLGEISLNPSATVAFEIGDDAADGGDTGVYLQLGIEPSFTIGGDGTDGGVTVGLPVTVGLSLDDYYEVAGDDETFGFVDVGVVASVVLLEDSGFGTVEAYAGVHLLLLGDHTQTINSGDDTEVIGVFGISTAF